MWILLTICVIRSTYCWVMQLVNDIGLVCCIQTWWKLSFGNKKRHSTSFSRQVRVGGGGAGGDGRESEKPVIQWHYNPLREACA